MEKIGETTVTVMPSILDGYKVEYKGYIIPYACMGLLMLTDKYTPERLENACRKAIDLYAAFFSEKYIQAILSSRQNQPKEVESALSDSPLKYGFTSGAKYYEGKKYADRNHRNKLQKMRLSVMAKAFKEQLKKNGYSGIILRRQIRHDCRQRMAVPKE